VNSSRFILFSLFALLGTLLLTLCCSNDTMTYTDEEKGYSIAYKTDWEKKDVDISIVFSSPKENEDDLFQEAVNVVVQDMSSMSMTLEQLTGHMEDYLEKASATIVKSEAATLGGIPGHKLVVTGNQGEMELKMQQVYTVVENKAYIVTYTAEADKFDLFLKDAEKMIDSFKVL
jgi:eukaryotic-like serine/threonine-protein kinase